MGDMEEDMEAGMEVVTEEDTEVMDKEVTDMEVATKEHIMIAIVSLLE